MRVVTFGSFDLFHIGHLRLLERARALGEELFVGVSTDAMNHNKKGKYPIYPEGERMQIISSLRCVDAVFREESLELKRSYLMEKSADILVMGDDWRGRFDEFKDIVDVVYLSRTEEISTTLVENFIKTRDPKLPGWLRQATAG